MVAATQAQVAVRDVVAVEEIGDATIVLDAGHAYVLRGGAIASVSEAPHGFRGGGTIAAPDGDGRWAVGFDREGQLWRITIGGELEAVSDRFKLAGARIDAIAGAGAVSAFALADGLAVSDGIRLQRTTTPAPAG